MADGPPIPVVMVRQSTAEQLHDTLNHAEPEEVVHLPRLSDSIDLRLFDGGAAPASDWAASEEPPPLAPHGIPTDEVDEMRIPRISLPTVVDDTPAPRFSFSEVAVQLQMLHQEQQEAQDAMTVMQFAQMAQLQASGADLPPNNMLLTCPPPSFIPIPSAHGSFGHMHGPVTYGSAPASPIYSPVFYGQGTLSADSSPLHSPAMSPRAGSISPSASRSPSPGPSDDSSPTRHACAICGKTFSCAANRIRHQNIHTANKVFKCAVCGRDFNNSSNRRKHERKQHRYFAVTTAGGKETIVS